MKYKIAYTAKFIKQSTKLLHGQKDKLTKLLGILGDDPFSNELHTKALRGDLDGDHSFRITRDYRVIFRFSKVGEILLLRVLHRKDIYR